MLTEFVVSSARYSLKRDFIGKAANIYALSDMKNRSIEMDKQFQSGNFKEVKRIENLPSINSYFIKEYAFMKTVLQNIAMQEDPIINKEQAWQKSLDYHKKNIK